MNKEIKPLDKVLRDWAIISIDRFQEQLVLLDVGELDGGLMRSFLYEVRKSGNDGFQVLIKFLKYGRFVDMGVGKGSPLGHNSIITSATGNRYRTSTGHTAKKWYSKVKTREVAILKFIMLKQFSILTLRTLETELKNIDKAA